MLLSCLASSLVISGWFLNRNILLWMVCLPPSSTAWLLPTLPRELQCSSALGPGLQRVSHLPEDAETRRSSVGNERHIIRQRTDFAVFYLIKELKFSLPHAMSCSVGCFLPVGVSSLRRCTLASLTNLVAPDQLAYTVSVGQEHCYKEWAHMACSLRKPG